MQLVGVSGWVVVWWWEGMGKGEREKGARYWLAGWYSSWVFLVLDGSPHQ